MIEGKVLNYQIKSNDNGLWKPATTEEPFTASTLNRFITPKFRPESTPESEATPESDPIREAEPTPESDLIRESEATAKPVTEPATTKRWTRSRMPVSCL